MALEIFGQENGKLESVEQYSNTLNKISKTKVATGAKGIPGSPKIAGKDRMYFSSCITFFILVHPRVTREYSRRTEVFASGKR